MVPTYKLKIASQLLFLNIVQVEVWFVGKFWSKKCWYWLKLTKFYSLSLPRNFQSLQFDIHCMVQSYSRLIFLVQFLYRWEDRILLLPTMSYSKKIFLLIPIFLNRCYVPVIPMLGEQKTEEKIQKYTEWEKSSDREMATFWILIFYNNAKSEKDIYRWGIFYINVNIYILYLFIYYINLLSIIVTENI